MRMKHLMMTLVIFLASPMLLADIAVIVKKDVADSEVAAGEIANIFLGRTKELPSGAAVKPVDLKKGDPIKVEFYEKVVGKSEKQAIAAWAKLVFTGRGKAPPEKASAAEVKAYVVGEGGIGYIDSKDVDDSVKVILKVP